MSQLSVAELKQISNSFLDLETRKSTEITRITQVWSNLWREETEIKLECLRCLRNLVAGVQANAIVVKEFLEEGNNLKTLVEGFLDPTGGDCLGLRVLMQLLANILSQGLDLQGILGVSEVVFTQSRDCKTSNALCYGLLYLMKKTSDLKPFLYFLPGWINLVQEADGETEFVLLCCKQLLLHCSLEELLEQSRLPAFKLLQELELVEDIPEDSVVCAVNMFTFLTDAILTTNLGSVELLKPEEILTLLDLISAASLCKHRARLQGMKSLLINTVYLLRMVHEAGKNGVKDFQPIGKLSELAKLKQNQSDLDTQPVFGFKVKLISLLVNLVWEHTENKTLVGEIEGLQLILDCSQIDGKNPLITQWVILSVKALCDQHPENQEILLNLRRQGAADASLLKELGIQLAPTSAFS